MQWWFFFSEVAAAVSIFCFAAEPLDTFRVGGECIFRAKVNDGGCIKARIQAKQEVPGMQKVLLEFRFWFCFTKTIPAGSTYHCTTVM